MDTEKVIVKLISPTGDIMTADLLINDNIGGDEDTVIIEIDINQKNFSGKCDNHFGALVELRRCLEKDNIHVFCNGTAKNVYPSAMQFSMGNTRKAYKLSLGKQAFMKDMVDIFDYDQDCEFVTVNEQMRFYNDWIQSLSNR